jgi:AraC-like DNA-binding protein
MFKVLETEDDQHRIGNELYITTVLVQMLLLISRFQETAELNHETKVSQRSFQIVNHINKNYVEDIKLDQLADMLHISSNHLCKIFKADTGYTVFQYLNIVRIKNAALMLSTSNKKITEVAFDCGFKNINHFTHIFKKQLGITPSKYKKMNQ